MVSALCGGKLEFRPQSPFRRGLELEPALIKMGKIGRTFEPLAPLNPFCQLVFAKPGPSSSTVTVKRAAPSSRLASALTRDLAHLQALSSRLPTISSKSCFSP